MNIDQFIVKSGRVFLSIMFIFSAVSKLISLAFFDGLVAELLLGPNYFDHYQALWWIQVLTRFLISAELLLGAALLQELYLKKLVLPAIQLMLILFTVHLFYEGFKNGFVDGNCGCFGDVLPMTNLESIIKNALAMIIGGVVWMKYKAPRQMRFGSWVMPFLLGLITFLTVWMSIKDYSPAQKLVVPEVLEESLNPDILPLTDSTKIDSSKTKDSVIILEVKEKIEEIKTVKKEMPKEVKEKVIEENFKPKEPSPLDITKNLIGQYQIFSDNAIMDLETGEKIVCMFSMTCGHCQEIYKDFCETQQYASFPKLYLINYGKEFEQNFFFNQAGGCKDSHIRIENYPEFMRLLEGKSFPRILVFKNGQIVKEWNIDTYSKQSFLNHYGITEQETKSDDLLDSGNEGMQELDF